MPMGKVCREAYGVRAACCRFVSLEIGRVLPTLPGRLMPMGKVCREAYGVRQLAKLAGALDSGLVPKRQQAARTPYASRGSVTALPGCAVHGLVMELFSGAFFMRHSITPATPDASRHVGRFLPGRFRSQSPASSSSLVRLDSSPAPARPRHTASAQARFRPYAAQNATRTICSTAPMRCCSPRPR